MFRYLLARKCTNDACLAYDIRFGNMPMNFIYGLVTKEIVQSVSESNIYTGVHNGAFLK